MPETQKAMVFFMKICIFGILKPQVHYILYYTTSRQTRRSPITTKCMLYFDPNLTSKPQTPTSLNCTNGVLITSFLTSLVYIFSRTSPPKKNFLAVSYWQHVQHRPCRYKQSTLSWSYFWTLKKKGLGGKVRWDQCMYRTDTVTASSSSYRCYSDGGGMCTVG